MTARAQMGMDLGLEEHKQARKTILLPTSFDIPAIQCPRGCGTLIVVGSCDGQQVELEPSNEVYLWCGARLFARPSNGLVLHLCAEAQG